MGSNSPRAAGVSRAGVARWVFGFAILLAAGLTIAILNGAFSPPSDPLRIAWLMQQVKDALGAGKMSGPGSDTAATDAEVKARIAQEEQRRDELERQRREQERQAEQKRAEEAALAARIDGLLDQAGKAATAERWTTPAEDNVVSYAQQILALSPQHAEAQELIAKAARATAARDRSALEAADAANALDASAAEKDGSSSALDNLRAEARAALSANRLTTPGGDNAVEHADRMLRMPAGRKEAVQILRQIIGRYVAFGETALARGDIDKARGHQETAARIAERYRLSDTEVRELAKRLASPPETPRQPIAAPVASDPFLTEQEPELEIEKPPRELESMRSEQAVPEPAPGPTPGRDQLVGVSPEPAGQAQAVEILAAAPTQALAGPGDTIEFYTRFHLVPPPGRTGTYVEATWALKRDGRSLGQPGASSVFAKAGDGTLSTELTLPPGMAPGRYTVEHRIETENGEDSARSHFSVVSR